MANNIISLSSPDGINTTSGIFSGGLNVGGTITINATTASTSTTTGSLTIGGGVGIGSALNVAGAIRATTDLYNYGSGGISSNNAVGFNALYSNTTGNYNTANGMQALYYNTTGYYNTANGMQALYYNTTGYYNTANGMQALYYNTTGYYNTANGYAALYSNTTGYYNTANGYAALYSNTTGYYNTANGYAALYYNTTGYNNTMTGFQSGYGAVGVNANTTGSNNTFLGFRTVGAGAADTNEIVIGANAVGMGSNTTVIGNTSTTGTYIPAGGLYVTGTISATGTVTPRTDNTYTLGGASFRWTTVYATTGTINTSDARQKTHVSSLKEAEITAAKQLSKEVGTFQWLSSVTEKGADKARLHVGFTVQRAIEIMAENGLDAMRYAFICYDKWDDTLVEHPTIEAVAEVVAVPAKIAVFNADGDVLEDAKLAVKAVAAVEAKAAWIETTLKAGDAYAFRYDQLNIFIAAGLNARLEALEGKL